MSKPSNVVQTRSAFFYQCSWYVNVDRKRVKLCEGTAEERQRWRDGKRMKDDGAFPLRDEIRRALIEFETFQGVHCGKATAKLWTLVELYLQAVEQDDTIAVGTFRSKRSYLGAFASSKYFGNRDATTIRPSDAEAFLKSRRIKSPNTVCFVHGILMSFFNWCVDNNYLAVNPIAKLKAPKQLKRIRVVSDSDYERIIRNSNRRFGEFIIALFNTGRRPIEIARLRRRDVRFKDCEPVAFETMTHKNVKKTGLPEYIPLNANMRRLVAEILSRPGEPTDHLFLNSHDGKWTSTNWCRRMEILNRHHGTKLTAYWFRHEFITRSLFANVPIAVIAQICGTSPEVIQKHYDQTASLSKVHFHEAMERATASIPVVA